jgi:hypothetical protein
MGIIYGTKIQKIINKILLIFEADYNKYEIFQKP